MTINEGIDLSPDQKRYKEITVQCGLDHEEALHALGRRSGCLNIVGLAWWNSSTSSTS